MQVFDNFFGNGTYLKIPDEFCSMFDEELFIEIYDTSIADGTIFSIEMDGVEKLFPVFGSVGRLYLDDFFFDDFNSAYKKVNFGEPINKSIKLIPKKSIGDIEGVPFKPLPLWNGRNALSYSGSFYVHMQMKKQNLNILSSFAFEYDKFVATLNTYKYGISEDQEAFVDTYPKTVLPCHTYFEWIDDDGFWRSWYFVEKEMKVTGASNMIDIHRNISTNGNERIQRINLKSNKISKLFTSGYENEKTIKILNSIKTSSFVFMGDDLERVNVKSEESNTYNIKPKEFIFSIEYETKIAR